VPVATFARNIVQIAKPNKAGLTKITSKNTFPTNKNVSFC